MGELYKQSEHYVYDDYKANFSNSERHELIRWQGGLSNAAVESKKIHLKMWHPEWIYGRIVCAGVATASQMDRYALQARSSAALRNADILGKSQFYNHYYLIQCLKVKNLCEPKWWIKTNNYANKQGFSIKYFKIDQKRI